MKRSNVFQIFTILFIASSLVTDLSAKNIGADNFESYDVNSYPSSNWYNSFGGVEWN